VGIEAWLYDEDPYPSGAAGGKVVLENPEYRASCLIPKVFKVEGPGQMIVDLDPGALIGAYLVRGTTIERIDGQAGIIRSEWRQFHSTAGYYPPYSGQGSPHWRAETFNPHYCISAEIHDAPAYIVGFVRQYINQNPWGAYPDPLNPKAVESFIESTHLQYEKLFLNEFGKTIPGIFTDEAKLLGQLPWSESLAALFLEVSGLQLHQVLPHLVLDVDGQTPYIRWAYREALARGLQDYFVDPLKAACESRGLFWTGHMSPEEDPIGQVVYVPGLLRTLGKMDIPGTDLIGAAIGDANHPLLHLSPKLASSAAHAANKPQVACEVFAVTDWSQDFSFLTKVAHWLYALGVNRLVTHGQFYSIDGLRKREAPPSQFFQASYWEHFRAFSDSIKFLSEQLVSGVHEAPILLYYPEESFMALSFSDKSREEPDRSPAWMMREGFGNTVHDLLISGYDFDLADADLLSKVDCQRGLIELGRESYQAVIVPGSHLCESSWTLLCNLQQAGHSVYFLEEEILILSEEPYSVSVKSYSWEDLPLELRKTISPTWESRGNLIGHKRITDQGPLLFLCNNAAVDFEGPVRLDFEGPYEVCDPKNELWWFAGEALSIDLSAGQGVLIRTARSLHRAPYIRQSQWRSVSATWKPWQAEIESDNCLVLSEFRMLSREPGVARSNLPAAELFATAPMVDLLSPASLSGSFPPPNADRFLLASFDWQGPVVPLRLLCDSDLGLRDKGSLEPKMAFFLNQQPIPEFQQRRTYDPMNREVRIDSLVKQGRNNLLWIQQGCAQPHLPWPYDAVRLFGGFHVEFPYGRPVPARLTERQESYLCGMPVPPAQLGHAHYGGIVQYRSEFSMKVVPRRIALRFGHVYETAEVLLNGQSVGHLWTAPYTLEVDPMLIRPGENELILRCSTSPANYLQALNRPAGTLGVIEWCEVIR